MARRAGLGKGVLGEGRARPWVGACPRPWSAFYGAAPPDIDPRAGGAEAPALEAVGRCPGRASAAVNRAVAYKYLGLLTFMTQEGSQFGKILIGLSTYPSVWMVHGNIGHVPISGDRMQTRLLKFCICDLCPEGMVFCSIEDDCIGRTLLDHILDAVYPLFSIPCVVGNSVG